MKANKSFKNKITNLAGLVMAVCGVIAAGGFAFLPLWAVQAAGLLTALSGAVVAYYTGKNDFGQKKSGGYTAY